MSVAVTELSLAGVTALAQDTVVSPGKVFIVGAVVSLTVMVWVQVAVLPLESVAL